MLRAALGSLAAAAAAWAAYAGIGFLAWASLSTGGQLAFAGAGALLAWISTDLMVTITRWLCQRGC